MVELGGRAALVTGGGRGIGAAVARRLAAAGAVVAVNAHASSNEVDAVVAETGPDTVPRRGHGLGTSPRQIGPQADSRRR